MKQLLAMLAFLAALAAFCAQAHGQQESIEAMIASAEEHEAGGRVDEAIAAWKAVSLGCLPEDRANGNKALSRLWAIMQPRGRFSDFEETVRAVILARPKAGWALAFLAMVLQSRGDFDAALDVYTKIVDQGEPEAGWAAFNAGSILVRKQETQIEAADAYVESLRISPGMKDSLGFDAVDRANNVALQMVAWRRFGDARRIWESIIAIPGVPADKRARVCFYVAMLDYRVGRFQQTEGALLAAIELAPSDPEYVSNLGLVYLTWGKEEEALKTWERCLSIDPEYADAFENLGYYWSRRGDSAKSSSYLARGHAIACRALAKAVADLEASKAAGSTDLAALQARLANAQLRKFRFETHIRKAIR